MGKMKELVVDIADMLYDGMDPLDIAKRLNVPVEMVNGIAATAMDSYDDSMDGDEASALASVGWGTDEDYGYCGDD